MTTSTVIDLEVSDEQSTSDTTSSELASGPNIHTEPVSAIIGKCFQKATTAPPTIRHFFKPKQPGNGKTTKSADNEPERNAEVDDDGVSDAGDFVMMSDRKQTSNEPASLQQENAAESRPVLGKGKICFSTISDSSAAKRLSSDKPPANKKPKQSSIQSLFAARNPQKQPSAMQCPICSRTFDQSTSNAQVNEHIDNCLVE